LDYTKKLHCVTKWLQ